MTSKIENPKSKTVVIGIGNEYRRDDGVGLVVARRVAARAPDDIAVCEESGEGVALMDAWDGAETVILCDAVQSGAGPGTIHRLDAQACPIPTQFFHYSTHAFSVAEAVELARALDSLPPRLLIYGIEGTDYTSGIGLSSTVGEAAARVERAILADLDQYAAAQE